MSSIWDSNLRDFRDRTASHAPTPGGGAVAAVAATEGLALVLMALEVNLRRKEPNPESGGILRRGKDLIELLSACADEDIEVFGRYMKAMVLPKNNPEQEQARSRALTTAASNALEAPLRAAELCLGALTLAREAIGAVHSGIASDVGAGAALIHGALTATLYNVDINLKSIEAPAHYSEASATRKDLQRRADELAYVIQKETLSKINKS
jgi:formiminotetrahydrofolate cyclodeaminase